MTIVRRSANRVAVINDHKGLVIRSNKGEVDVDVHHGHDIVFKFRKASLEQVKAAVRFVKEGK